MSFIRAVTLLLLTAAGVVGCGGSISNSSDGGSSGGSSSTDNVQSVSVNLGPEGNYVNGIFTSVTVCVPGTSTCQTIDNVLVDSGSYGLRLLGSAVSAALPVQTTNNLSRIGECAVFADGYAWGPVVTADVRLANETASSVPVQLIGSTTVVADFPSAPNACSSGAGQAEDTLATLGTNGVLGVGVFAQDCGNSCAVLATNGLYFACNSGSQCSSTTQSLAMQVQNPVALFAQDNNGVQIVLPAISGSGAQTVNGSLIFGIGTQSNNGLGSAQVLTTDGFGNVSATYNSTSYPKSFIDSGSNALFFYDASIPACSDAADFYCPTSTLTLSAQITGSNGTKATAPFSVANADSLFASNNYAFDNLAGTTGSTLDGSFDFGLPFFFGRTISFAIDNASTPGGDGPYFAY